LTVLEKKLAFQKNILKHSAYSIRLIYDIEFLVKVLISLSKRDFF